MIKTHPKQGHRPSSRGYRPHIILKTNRSVGRIQEIPDIFTVFVKSAEVFVVVLTSHTSHHFLPPSGMLLPGIPARCAVRSLMRQFRG